MLERDGYRLRDADPVAAQALGSSCGLGAAAAQVLLQRGLADAEEAREHLDARLSGLTCPDTMLDRLAATERLVDAIRKKHRIAIFGDYDVDGTTSTAILADILEALGADVRAFVANRFQGGYGFSDQALDRCLEVRPDLIVTCDCGSSDHARVARAVAAGVDVIVVDHHLVPEEPLPTVAFLNPHRPECGFPYKGMASAGLAFSLGAAVRAALGQRLDLRPWLDLVALGTVADVAPLDGDNRRLVRAGLKLLARRELRPGVSALREAARLTPGIPVCATEIAFRLAPRLNAAGRLGDATITLDLLRCRDRGEGRLIAAKIEQLNDERKDTERRCTREAYAQVEEVYGARPEHGVVVASTGWHRGVVGITAARLVDRYHVPAVVVAIDDGVGHGSGRTPKGFHLYDAFAKGAAELVRFGGHAAAAGMTLRAERLDAFRACFADASAGFRAADAERPVVDVEVDGDRYPLPSISDLARLEPLGQGNAIPLFSFPGAQVADRRIVGDGHLKLKLRVGDQQVSAFGRDMGGLRDELPDIVCPLGSLRPDHWRGGGSLELSLVRLQ